MFPRFQFKVNNKTIVDSERFVSDVEGTVLNFKLEDSDIVPCAIDSEHLAIGGWKLNVVSLIDSKTSSEFVVEGWKSLEKLIPLKRLMIPFLYSTVIHYARFGVAPIEPHWTSLLRLCFWYQKCLEINDRNFHYKQSEIKRAVLKPLSNTEKALAKAKDFLSAMEQLNKTITSYTSELEFPSLAYEQSYAVSFSKENDFVIDDLPVEVKSVRSHITIEHQESGIPNLKIHGQVFGEKVNPSDELGNFIKSRKVWRHICEGYCQNGKIIFLDATYTFASILLYLLSTNKVDLSFCGALKVAVKVAREKQYLPVVVTASVSGDEQRLLAFAVPIPLGMFSG